MCYHVILITLTSIYYKRWKNIIIQQAYTILHISRPTNTHYIKYYQNVLSNINFSRRRLTIINLIAYIISKYYYTRWQFYSKLILYHKTCIIVYELYGHLTWNKLNLTLLVSIFGYNLVFNSKCLDKSTLVAINIELNIITNKGLPD